jgi:hypothetical protein
MTSTIYEVVNRQRKLNAILAVLDDQRWLAGDDDADALSRMSNEWWDKISFEACVWSPSVQTRAAIVDTVRRRK